MDTDSNGFKVPALAGLVVHFSPIRLFVVLRWSSKFIRVNLCSSVVET